jgi:hypothetical protein
MLVHPCPPKANFVLPICYLMFLGELDLHKNSEELGNTEEKHADTRP